MAEQTLHTIQLDNIELNNGGILSLPLSYQYFGPDLGTAPIVLVNHALTGNSLVAGDLGWWNQIIGNQLIVDTTKYTVLVMNIPGNGYDHYLIENYRDYIADDIATIFLQALDQLNISSLHSIIGGSLGGAIAWHILIKNPTIAKYFIPIATDWKTTDWLHSVCLIQEDLLNQPDYPIQKARRHAMLCYRTPKSLNHRFNNEIDSQKQVRKSQDWLDYHGNQLNNRFSLSAYRLMNQLLKTIEASDLSDEELAFKELSKISAEIHLIAIDSDMLFPAFEIKQTYHQLKSKKENTYYHEITSPHGHDAFLMEHDQLKTILNPIFSSESKQVDQSNQSMNDSKKHVL